MNSPLVLEPSFSFDALDHMLTGLGWTREPLTTVTPPLIPGEPELAAWQHESGVGRAVYTFNPVVSFRVITFYKTLPPSCLPLLTTDAVLKLLEDKDPPKILLGLLAFDRLQPLTGVEKLDRLQSHSDPNVAKMATRILEKLAGETLQAGLSILQPFDDPQDRADVLRWMIKDKLPVNERMVTALQAALEDRDWQVRMTAVVACVRLGVRELGPAVSKVQLPKTSWEGCDSETRRRLREIHRASLHLLAGAPPEDTHPARNRLFRALAGLPVDEPDELSWLVDQLATPRPEY